MPSSTSTTTIGHWPSWKLNRSPTSSAVSWVSTPTTTPSYLRTPVSLRGQGSPPVSTGIGLPYKCRRLHRHDAQSSLVGGHRKRRTGGRRRHLSSERRTDGAERRSGAPIADSGAAGGSLHKRPRCMPNGRYGAAAAYGWVGQPALEDRAPSRGRVPLPSCFVPTMHRATPGTRTLPSFSNALTFAMAFARIRSRAGSSTC